MRTIIKINKVLTNDLFLFFLLLISFIAVEGFTSGGEYFYSSLGWIDHWLYLGHFEYTPLFESSHLWNYKSSRLLWIWQGHLIFKYFSYPYNNYFIAIFSLTKFWLVFWLVIREYLFNKKHALFYICIFMFYPTLRNNGGWFYHNLEACSWWLLSIYILRLVETKRLADKFIALAGLFAGFSISTNLIFINFLPTFILITPKLFYNKKSMALVAILGVISSVFILGMINLLLGGAFTYYLPILSMVSKYNGDHEFVKPFLQSESFKLFILMSSVASYVLYTKINEYRKTRIYHHLPFSIAYLYTAIVYLLWHLKGIEVLSVSIHNSMLLLTGILMLAEAGENLVKKTVPNYILIYIYILSWISIHYFNTPSDLLFNFSSILSAPWTINITILLSLISLLWISTKTKSLFLWFTALAMIPYGMSPYRIYPQFEVSGDKCFNGRRSHDIVFDIKEEIQKISAPMVLSLQGDLEIANTIDYIGMHNKWPRKKNFDAHCNFSVAETNMPLKSMNFPYLAIISNSKSIKEEYLQCKSWPKYDNIVIHKEYKPCNGGTVFFSILSAID